MKNKLLPKVLLPAFIILISGVFNQSKAQVVRVYEREKKSDHSIFLPSRKKSYPVIIRSENKLPPGQEKKIYGVGSAKRFAPGQEKKLIIKTGSTSIKTANIDMKIKSLLKTRRLPIENNVLYPPPVLKSFLFIS